MDWALPAVFTLGGVAVVAGLAYWTVVISEGAYFGPWLVAFLYDRGADTYDDIKEFDAVEDGWFLGIPMMRNLEAVRHPLVLDVATGTGRMTLSLLRQLAFDGHVIGLDLSREMLDIARGKTQRYAGRATLIRQDATSLPFADESFEAVACVEALEFLTDPTATLAEMVRVLRPGGSFLVTNRISWERFLLPGRAFAPGAFESMLIELGLEQVWTKPWQTYYDLIWAQKPGALKDRGAAPALDEVLRCPICDQHGQQPLNVRESVVTCPACGHAFARNHDIIEFET